MQTMRVAVLGLCLAAGSWGCSGVKMQPPSSPMSVAPDHVVIVLEENHSYSEIIGSSAAPYINSLATQGALLTQSFAIAHPSQPNYLALFSGSTQGITDDSCPHTFSGSTLETELLAAGKTFAAYSEGLPQTGSSVCSAGEYARKHSPWSDFSQDNANNSRPFTSFPSDFSKLPLVSFVIPDLDNDMHDGTIQQADAWLQTNLSAYVSWAINNNSLLIVTWDEDDGSENNHVPTIFVGEATKGGQYSETINHYSVLRTIENFYGLPALANAANATPITDIWK